MPIANTETAMDNVVITLVNKSRIKDGSINLSKKKNGIIAEMHDTNKHLQIQTQTLLY